MNMFTVQILQILLKSGNVRLQTLTDSLGLTRRMVLYYQKQLNDFLSKENLGSTFLQDDALFLASSDMQKIPEILETLDLNQYYLEASERQECILLKIGIPGKPQFLETLTEEFHVSRRTLTNDLICIKEQLIQHNIHLLSRQKQGYYLSGDEWMIRYLLLSAYHRRTNLCIDRIKKNLLLEAYQYYCAESAPEQIFERLRLILIDSETYCGERFIYFSLPDLAQSLLLVCLRGKKESVCLPMDSSLHFTESLPYIEQQLSSLGLNLSPSERSYLGLMLQSAKISHYENGKIEEPIEALLTDMIDEFRQVSGLNLSRTSELFEMFAMHVRSMYYRTKYRIKITELYDESGETDPSFLHLTKKTMEHLAPKYDLLLDDGELQFLSYYFCCMSHPNETLTQQPKAKIVIVCASGLGSSVYVRYQVSRLLEHSFSIVISDLRSLNKVLDQNTRLILSTLDIAPEYTKNIKTLRASTILSPEQKKELIDWLLHEEVYLQNNGLVSDLLNIIKEHAVIQEQEKLFLKLNSYFNPDPLPESEPGLAELMHPDFIQIYESAKTWQDAIQKAALPLLNAGMIRNGYVSDMIDVISQYGPYCEFVSRMLLAHADPKSNIISPAISLSVFHTPIQVPEWEKEITAVFILGITEQTSHATALSELVSSLTAHDAYRTLHQLENPEAIYQVLVPDKPSYLKK